MMRFFSVLTILVLIRFSSFAQLVNFNSTGKRIPIREEKISLTIEKISDQQDSRSSTPTLSLPGIISNILGVSFDIGKTLITAQQTKYTATYTATKSENGLIYNKNHSISPSGVLNIAAIDIRRITDNTIASEIVLSPILEPSTGLFRLKVDSILLPFSKAKIKRNGAVKGKSIDISLDIKLEAIWKESEAKKDTSVKGKSSEKQNQLLKDSTTYSLKSAILGQSTILITSIHPANKVVAIHDCTSGWFQLIPQEALKFANGDEDWKTGWYTITITVKEVNPYAFNSKELSDFLNTNNTDISNLLKQLIPSAK